MTAAARFAPDPSRRALLAKLHIAKKELGLDDGVYRAILMRLTRHDSAAACSEADLRRVLDELKAKGWTQAAKPRSGTAPKVRRADHPAAKKARALWLSLHQLGVVRNRTESALEAFAARQLHVERLQWADQAQVYKLIEALKAMAERAGWSQDLAGVPKALQVGELKLRLLNAIKLQLGEATFNPGWRNGPDQLDQVIDLAAARLREKGAA